MHIQNVFVYKIIRIRQLCDRTLSVIFTQQTSSFKSYTSDENELSGKEKERLVFNYLQAHRNEFMKEENHNGGQKEHDNPTKDTSDPSYPANMYQHENSLSGKAKDFDRTMNRL